MAVAGRGGQVDGVPAVPGRAGARLLAPAGCLLGVVAGLAEALATVGGGVALLGHRDDVVGVADGRTAPGVAAPLVAVAQEGGELVGEPSLAGVHRDQLTGL